MQPVTESGALYVVATPIGNIGDLSARARAVLENVDWIAAEDTRVTRRLFAAAQAPAPRARLLALHAHNESAQATRVTALLAAGASVALVSDAGTPAISDPGAELVRAVRAGGHPVYAVPGPNAAIAALSVSGIDCSTFTFAGFLPAARGARRSAIEALRHAPGALVLHEAPHRVVECCVDLCDVLGGERRLFVARELTKLFESQHACRLAEAAAWLEADADRRRGEFVLIVEASAQPASPAQIGVERVLAELLPVLPASRAAQVASRLTGVTREEAYRLALAMQGR